MSSRAQAYGIALVFLLVRLALLVVREPFFDELFTVWLARKPLTAILPALLLDSGPPLYYFIARIPDVFALRVLSLLFATATLALLLTRQSLGNARFLAAALLAVYPPAALFAVDARAYALCGLFLTIGIIGVHEKRPWVAAIAFLLAAYTHWYGALFLPLILFVRRIPFFVACVLFLPGLWLASQQPPEATEWLSGQNPFAALNAFAFAGRYAEALFLPAPWIIVIVSAIALVIAASRRFTFAPFVLLPLFLAIAFALGGRTVYFPMRFESVIAVPLVLWLATSLEAWTPLVRRVLLATLIACGAITLAIGILDHQRRPVDAYAEAAGVLRENARAGERIVATGFLYLEAVHELGAARVHAWPAEQGRHPGWRVMRAPTDPLPPGPFLWIGEREAPELVTLRRTRRVAVLFANDRALILRVQ
ncbi:MAG: hypothetical protein ACLGH0_09370 [Thermoanaerobaculia bacterium]